MISPASFAEPATATEVHEALRAGVGLARALGWDLASRLRYHPDLRSFSFTFG
jgi:hypothetical protein